MDQKRIQQINFMGNLDEHEKATMIWNTEKAKEIISAFS